MNKNTLLITGTIKPLIDVKYGNPQIRLTEYIRNIKRYICESDFDTIIFAENSGYEFDVLELIELAKERNKHFEFLNLSNNCDRHNMSTGDAELMRQSIKVSKELTKMSNIWKVSGRVFIRNINEILQFAEKKTSTAENIFLYSPRYKSIETWFFRANVQDLLEYFLTDESVEAMKNSCIEYVWASVYRENESNIKMKAFGCYPDAEGTRSGGNSYSVSRMKLFIRNILLKLGWYTVK